MQRDAVGRQVHHFAETALFVGLLNFTVGDIAAVAAISNKVSSEMSLILPRTRSVMRGCVTLCVVLRG